MQSPSKNWFIFSFVGLAFILSTVLNCRSINSLQSPEGEITREKINQVEIGKQLLATIQSDPCVEDIVFGVPEDSWRCQNADAINLENPERIITSTIEAEKLGDAYKDVPRINWDQADEHIGELITVCGPVVSSHFAESTNGQPTFLNVGKEYPDPQRFTILIWGSDLDRFPFTPDEYYFGNNVCVSGTIVEYQGSLEIEVAHPRQIEIQK